MESVLKKRTQDSLSNIWKIKSDEMKYQFGLHLYQYAAGKYFDYNNNLNLNLKKEVILGYRKTNRSSSLARQFQRLLLGYHGVRSLSPIICDLSSEEANRKPKVDKTTSDHIIGVTLCSRYAIKVFKQKLIEVLILKNVISENSLNEDPFEQFNSLSLAEKVIEDMCENWLLDHLWLWAQCRVTVTEHKAENISRTLEKFDTLEEEILHRANFKHYSGNIKIDNYLK